MCSRHVVKPLGITVKKAVEKMSKQKIKQYVLVVTMCSNAPVKPLGITVKKAVEKMSKQKN
jgi:prophage tail gpP-like protein